MSDRADAPLKPYPHPSAESVIRRILPAWMPPEPITLSKWAEENVVLPEEQRARPGEYRNWPYMREILDVMGDVQHERVTILKSARIGYTAGLVIAIGAIAVTDPSQILLLMPTDEDATEIAVDTVEPIFEATPILRGMLRRDRTGRNNTRNRIFVGGGSLKIRSGRAPRKLRRIDVQYLIIDEADGIEMTKEGDAISLAEKRTLAKTRRKIIKGSTPTEEDVSVVWRDFLAGDRRLFEVPCPHATCNEYSEIVWEDVKYRCDDTGNVIEDVYWQCPRCKQRVDERYKPSMIAHGRWRITNPVVKDHASFRINALSALLPQATWKKICAEHLKAKREGIGSIQVFHNTILGRPWKTSLNKIDAETLMQRAEPIGRPNAFVSAKGLRGYVVPPEVLAVTVGVDVQDNRLEATVVGWTMERAPVYLEHAVFDGSTLKPEVWAILDRWHADWTEQHPAGWHLKVDAMAVDSGGREGRTQVIYDWCAERLSRGIYAIKGDDGPNRKVWQKAKKVKGTVSLYIVGTDQLKASVLDQLGRIPEKVDSDGVIQLDERGVPLIDPYHARFSDGLEQAWFEQVTGEVRRVTLKAGRSVIEFKSKLAGATNEALYCAAYAQAVTSSAFFSRIDMRARSKRLKTPTRASAPSSSAETNASRPVSDTGKPVKRRSISDLVRRIQGTDE